jgi:hypothetical protein
VGENAINPKKQTHTKWTGFSEIVSEKKKTRDVIIEIVSGWGKGKSVKIGRKNPNLMPLPIADWDWASAFGFLHHIGLVPAANADGGGL